MTPCKDCEKCEDEKRIEWYADEDLAIYFTPTPCVSSRVILPSMSKAEKASITRYPFENKRRLNVELYDHNKGFKYEFTIPKFYNWDGASIPRLVWRLIGAKTDPRFLIPSLIHDVLCENHHYVKNDRYFADKVFERLLYCSKVNAFSRWMMFHSVDNFQKFQGWG
jgi:hypothetical protein